MDTSVVHFSHVLHITKWINENEREMSMCRRVDVNAGAKCIVAKGDNKRAHSLECICHYYFYRRAIFSFSSRALCILLTIAILTKCFRKIKRTTVKNSKYIKWKILKVSNTQKNNVYIYKYWEITTETRFE